VRLKKSAKQREVEGKVQEVVGNARKQLGAAVGAQKEELKGGLQEAAGKDKQRRAKVQKWVKKAGDDANEAFGRAIDTVTATAAETNPRH
jgi:uncharacterized protein YjbJ (UPF0337 family)